MQIKTSVVLSSFLFIFSSSSFADTNYKINVDGIQREYILHIPSSYTPPAPEGGNKVLSYPLIIALHGGGGTAEGMPRFTQFNKIADREEFIVVYPQGIDKQWTDGREADKIEKHDDVKFISRMLDTLESSYSIDRKRIFATGISNGGFFSIYLAYKLSDRILAAAPVCANIPENTYDSYTFDNPVSIILINGTDDPLVKYDGGFVGGKLLHGRGKSVSTDMSIAKWVQLDNCNASPMTEKIPNTEKDDDCTAEKFTYSGGKNSTDVILIKINNGGHTWPGGTQYLPKLLIGNLCKDFDASEAIWAFFKERKVRE